MRPKVTVMMPVHNGARYLAESIESVLRQDVDDFELVIVDDSSTDATYEVGKSFATDPRVRLYRNQKNRGESYTRNRILLLARGQYILPHDQDDIMLQGRLRRQLDFLEAHKDMGVVFGRVWVVNEDASKIEYEFGCRTNTERGALRSRPMREVPIAIHHNSAMFRKSLAMKAGGYDSLTSFNVDVRMMRRLFRLTRFYFLNHFCFLYRRHPYSMMHEYRRRRVMKMRAIYHPVRKLPSGRRFCLPLYGKGLWFESQSKALSRTLTWKLSFYDRISQPKSSGIETIRGDVNHWDRKSEEERFHEGFLGPLAQRLSERSILLVRGGLVSTGKRGILILSKAQKVTGDLLLHFLEQNYLYHSSASPSLFLKDRKVWGGSFIDPVILSPNAGLSRKISERAGLFWNPFLGTYCLHVDQFRPELIHDECMITHIVSVNVKDPGQRFRISPLGVDALYSLLCQRAVFQTSPLPQKLRNKLSLLAEQAQGVQVDLPRGKFAELPRYFSK